MPRKEYEYFVGIDYGTSTCKLAYATPPLRRGGDPVVKNFAFTRRGTDSSPRYPSSVVFDGGRSNRKRRVVTGFEAEKLVEDSAKSQFVDPVLSPKMDIGEGIVYPFGPPECSEPSDLCYVTIEQMIREFEKKLNTKRSRCKFLVTVPASFSSQHREELMEAIKRLGIDCDGEALIDEPNAAFLGMIGYPGLYPLLRRLRNGRLLIVDFGAGTCDLSLLQVEDDPTNDPYGVSLTNLGISDYARLGGNDIDRAVAEEVAPQAGVTDEGTSLYDKFLSIASVCARKTKELYMRNGRIGSGRKSKDDVVLMPMVKTGNSRTRAKSIPYSPDRLAEVVDTLLGRTGKRNVTLAALMANVLSKGGTKGVHPDVILLAGGSSGLFDIPYFRSFFFEAFPDMKEEDIVSSTDEGDLLVSRGAAVECLYRFGMKKPILRAICPSDVGIRTAEGEHRVLITAGSPLPYPNQEDHRFVEELYVPDPKPKTMRIPIAVRRFGVWVNVETWEVELPEEFLAGEAVQFSCMMNHEKVLTVEFRSDRIPGMRFEWVCHRWLHGREPTPREQTVKIMRDAMKETARKGGSNPPSAFVRLVWAEYQAEMYQTVRRRCEFLLQMENKFSKEQQAQLWNLHGLSCDFRLKGSIALNSYRKACEVDPTESVYQYNTAVTYLWNKGDARNAVHYLRRAMDLTPRDPKVIYWYGKAQEMLGNEAESRISFNHALDILKSGFTEDAVQQMTVLYRDLCDKKEIPYPEVLCRALDRDDENIDPMNIQPGLINKNDIVQSTRKGAKHEAKVA